MQKPNAVASALRSLSRRDMSELELRRKLQERGYCTNDIDDAIARMKGYGYLDDRRFARQWAESAIRNGRGFGRRLKLELVGKGVAEDTIADVLSSLTQDYDEREVLAAIVARRFAGFDFTTANDREKHRVVTYLQRRGFALSVILGLLNKHQDSR